jgi:hypothetical protein
MEAVHFMAAKTFLQVLSSKRLTSLTNLRRECIVLQSYPTAIKT